MTNTPETTNTTKRRAEVLRRALDVQERLEAELPELEAAWGADDPVTALVRAAIASGAPSTLEAAGAAAAARKVAELTGRPSVDQVAELGARYGVPVGEKHERIRALLEVPIAQIRGAEDLAAVGAIDGAARAVQIASLLDEVLAYFGYGESSEDAAEHVGRAERDLGATLLFEAPRSWYLDDAWLELGQVRCVGVGFGGFRDPQWFSMAKLKLRSVNAGGVMAPQFLDVEDCRAKRLPGAAVARLALSALTAEGGWDVSRAFLVVEGDKVIGVGGWGEPVCVDESEDLDAGGEAPPELPSGGAAPADSGDDGGPALAAACN
jgi:hypothetical protein